MRHVYSVLLYLLTPLVLLRLLLRSLREPAYRRHWLERFGLVSLPAGSRGVIWVHAVSVGEVHAAAPLVALLLREHPKQQLLFTTTTPSGRALVRELFAARVSQAYLPLDLPGAVQRFLTRVRPRLLILLETELWPNLLEQTGASGCKQVLANARLSAASARRYARLPSLTRAMLSHLDHVACQWPVDGERFLALGLSPQALAVTGTSKFDYAVDDRMRSERQAQRAALMLGGRPVLLAASTHPGEEALVIGAFKQLLTGMPNGVLLLAPRHPRRCAAVARYCRDEGLSVCLRSESRPVRAQDSVLLLDTLGELRLLSGLADVAVIGGSLVDRGGQNPLEAVAWGVPVICGPYTRNFDDVNARLADAGALIRLSDPERLAQVLNEMFSDPARRMAMARAGLAVMARERGASAAVGKVAAELLSDDGPDQGVPAAVGGGGVARKESSA
ncbi:MAG: lipid IV(A) 3-deoxy-D-manno-octulosonic acid transferase [Halioglobus sp.]